MGGFLAQGHEPELAVEAHVADVALLEGREGEDSGVPSVESAADHVTVVSYAHLGESGLEVLERLVGLDLGERVLGGGVVVHLEGGLRHLDTPFP